jgi:hypothetical protein
MDPLQLQTLLTWTAVALITLGVGGVALLGVREVRIGVRRRARLAGNTIVSGRPDTSSAAVAGVVSGVKRLGDRMAIQDPAQLSTIRAMLVQAGWFNREAVAFYAHPHRRPPADGTAPAGTAHDQGPAPLKA